nr:hypothetical protein CFP56_68761 [Quercus suber]
MLVAVGGNDDGHGAFGAWAIGRMLSLAQRDRFLAGFGRGFGGVDADGLAHLVGVGALRTQDLDKGELLEVLGGGLLRRAARGGWGRGSGVDGVAAAIVAAHDCDKALTTGTRDLQ